MKSLDIAIKFQKADYYTLKEARDYLNLKHGIRNITTKRILQNILKYETNVYFYAKGFTVYADYDTDTIKISNNQNVRNEIKKVDGMLSSAIYDGNGLFLRLCHDMLEQLRFNKISYFNDDDSVIFDGVLDIRRLDDNPETLDFLRKWISNDIFIKVLSIYIAIPFDEYDDEKESLDEIRKKSTLRFNDYYLSDTSNLLFPVGEITKDDLIILHKDLMILEENIINDSLPPEKNIFEIKPKKGVSQSKIRAKEQAKIIAKALWRTDKEQKIKIGEMANLVYAELYENGYIRQLPQAPMSLKEWIKEIAPSYAQDGGRPKKQ